MLRSITDVSCKNLLTHYPTRVCLYCLAATIRDEFCVCAINSTHGSILHFYFNILHCLLYSFNSIATEQQKNVV